MGELNTIQKLKFHTVKFSQYFFLKGCSVNWLNVCRGREHYSLDVTSLTGQHHWDWSEVQPLAFFASIKFSTQVNINQLQRCFVEIWCWLFFFFFNICLTPSVKRPLNWIKDTCSRLVLSCDDNLLIPRTVYFKCGHTAQDHLCFCHSPVIRQCTERHSTQNGSFPSPPSLCRWSQSGRRGECPEKKKCFT